MQTVTSPDRSTHCRRSASAPGGWASGRRKSAEVAAVRLALEMGYRVIDTAEMYGEGGAEEVVGAGARRGAARRRRCAREDAVRRQQGLSAQREPRAAPSPRASAACKRLGLDHIDLYLLHWRGSVRCTKRSLRSKTLRDADGSATGASATSTSTTCKSCCARRRRRALRDEPGLLLADRARPRIRAAALAAAARMPTMAYSPIDQGELARSARAAARSAKRRGATRGAARAGVAARAARRDGDSQGRARSAPAREPRGRGDSR